MVTEHLTSDMFPLVAAKCYDSDVYLTKYTYIYLEQPEYNIKGLKSTSWM